MNKIKGTGVALVTPFNKNGSIDYNSLKNLLNHVISGGVDYLVLLGTTGESVSLSAKEKSDVIKFCIDYNKKRLPIVVGLGGNNTSKVIDEIRNLNFEGIDAILSVSPSYNKPSQEGIYQHFKKISNHSPVPIIIYNVPGRTSSNISASTTIRLASDFNNIVAIKEASGDILQIMDIIRKKPDNFIVLSGDDALTLPMIYLGADGVISVIGQSHPKQFSNMVKYAISGKNTKANLIHFVLYDFFKPIYMEGNPVGIKACLEKLGICKSFVRLPLVEATENVKSKLHHLLNSTSK